MFFCEDWLFFYAADKDLSPGTRFDGKATPIAGLGNTSREMAFPLRYHHGAHARFEFRDTTRPHALDSAD
jgi:hypothetical protein